MHKIHFTIQINAPKEKVWDTMLSADTYTEWTEPFSPGSRFEGNWEEGTEIKFLDASSKSGMYSMVRENKKYEFVSVEHLGIVNDGVVDTTSDEVKKWAPAFENYTFTEKDGGTEVAVDMDISEEYKDNFQDMWPKALQKLKEISER